MQGHKFQHPAVLLFIWLMASWIILTWDAGNEKVADVDLGIAPAALGIVDRAIWSLPLAIFVTGIFGGFVLIFKFINKYRSRKTPPKPTLTHET